MVTRERMRGVVLIVALITLGINETGWAQSNSEWPVVGNLNQMMADWQAEPWELRKKAFYELLGELGYQAYQAGEKLEALFAANPGREEEIRLGLMGLLKKENAYLEHQYKTEFRVTGKTLTEDFGVYHGDLIGTVKALNDHRAAEAFVGAMGTGGMAVDGILEAGPAVLDAVMERSRDADEVIRTPAIATLGAILTPSVRGRFDSAAQHRIRERVLEAADDASTAVRQTVARILVVIPDEETIAILRRMADEDPGVLRGQGENGADLYPVQQQAAESLQQIEEAAIPLR